MPDLASPTPAGQVFSVALSGDLDLSRVPELHALVEHYRAGAAVDVVIDLRDVSFMDSSGLGFMARLYRAAKERGGTATVTHAHPEVERVIRITGLDHILVVDEPVPPQAVV